MLNLVLVLHVFFYAVLIICFSVKGPLLCKMRKVNLMRLSNLSKIIQPFSQSYRVLNRVVVGKRLWLPDITFKIKLNNCRKTCNYCKLSEGERNHSQS